MARSRACGSRAIAPRSSTGSSARPALARRLRAAGCRSTSRTTASRRAASPLTAWQPSRPSRRASSTPPQASAPTRRSTPPGRRSSPATSTYTTRAEPQQAAQVGLEPFRAVVQLPPGDPDHAPAGRLEAAVADAVEFEGVARVVKGAAVELDDEMVIRPNAVDL